ncbi:V-type ATP synthase subunit B [Neptunomonas phycophila]|uniref:V-type ATP synthase subunit B n=1 Tax=Neptunomonas TaxID=75687 RepID=UPI000948B552|nr:MULTISPECIES: V-type ATP synthase subunit B [Neptunomonas]MBT3144756.1 V-type ATP synthase subunit B [Neptunomonas phycophila]MDN2660896.1 V-type ATP synthase subunit B [Neptunomonas sp. CHC150]MDO6467853.1 V-type ATP synthase subunit B [Neptunomonas phycophila]MDO6783897.1 V-type ATP synthase subunit B [Neptunomonas phycophila]
MSLNSSQWLVRYSRILEIVGDIVKLEVPLNDQGQSGVCFGDLAIIESESSGHLGSFLAQVILLEQSHISLQVFSGTKGLSTHSSIRFLGHSMEAVFSPHILGRIFTGTGAALDHGPSLADEPKVAIDGPTVNPARRVLASKMIRTNVPMIDVFNCLVESQKIPIFSVAGEPYNTLLAQIGAHADADILVFGGIGLTFDDYYAFRGAFDEAGVLAKTVMYIHQGSDPVVEALLIPDMALAVAERFAVEEGKRVLVLLTDMTAYADALKEVGIALEHVPSNRGYIGDLYSQLAKRYERACDYQGAGSVTILSVTTMPGGDVTHPVPDNTGYITEGQFYLHDGVIDPFGSLSRLKQHVIGKETREDHGQIMNTMIRFYAASEEAAQKQAMSFDLSEYDKRLLAFGAQFRERFMDISASMPLEAALDLSWSTLAEHFQPDELLMKQALVDKYLPKKAIAEVENS